MSDRTDIEAPRAPFLTGQRARSAAWQAALLAALVWLVWSGIDNAARNMRARGIPTDFDFWNRTAGFDINATLIPFSAANNTYGDAFYVGLLNTLMVAACGIVLATVVGFLIGIARLSQNWMIGRLAGAYIEIIRNTPLLLQLLFWYNAVLTPLPGPRQSIALPGGSWINNRGLFLPDPHFGPGSEPAFFALGAGLIAAIVLARMSKRRRLATGNALPVLWPSLLMIVGLPMLVFAIAGAPVTFTYPELRGFNFVGGMRVFPEFVALLLGLSLYTAAFIAEIVRAGILSVSRGQTEASAALGLKPGQTMSLIIVPQALRVIIPPLTNQYLNLTKNSSLAVFIGYPDLVQVFAGTVLNQTGAAVQVITITMAVYLVISLITSAFMNWFNRRIALKER
ncbi:MAG: amino acid ABC transporter permease [Beijerinckiaceae bacterium]|nr:amino acid ABC transporter permease [Beijerinckiaceae bacterium]